MKNWVLYSLISMFIAGLTSVIAKMGLKNVSSDQFQKSISTSKVNFK
ncbi:hypothetical protein [Flavobacterium sp.]